MATRIFIWRDQSTVEEDPEIDPTVDAGIDPKIEAHRGRVVEQTGERGDRMQVVEFPGDEEAEAFLRATFTNSDGSFDEDDFGLEARRWVEE